MRALALSRTGGVKGIQVGYWNAGGNALPGMVRAVAPKGITHGKGIPPKTDGAVVPQAGRPISRDTVPH